ncbi:LysR family transcriptional regulator [Burkholderia sp. 22PA0099]|uniref:LysR family transcriptional regulator n=1 Tax=Burkholderia sp. 22PA0099 TaxID=3237372 RepID=UPI0039C32E9C
MDHLQSMRAFVAVAKFQSYTSAAEHLNVSRPVLSRTIRELEQQVGTRLLNRTTRKVSLAEGARDYLETCVRIIEMVDDAERRLADDTTSECGPIRIVVHPLAVASGIATVLHAFSTTSPCVELQVSMQDAPLNLVDSGCDAAIYPPDLILNSTVVNRPLFTSRNVLVASEPYLRKHGPLHTLRDLSRHRLIDGREAGAESRECLALHDEACPASLGKAYSAVPGLVARELALAGTGLAMLPELTVAADLARGHLLRAGLGDALSLGEISLGIQYQRSASPPRRVRTFIEACLSYFRTVGAAHHFNPHPAPAVSAGRDRAE